MARRIADVRLALKVIAGAHPRDPWSVDAPFESPPGAAPVGVAMVAEPPGAPRDPAIAKTVRDAGVALHDAGYAVDEVVPPRFEEAVSTWARFIIADFLSVREQLLPIMGKDSAFFFETAASALPALDAAGMSRS
jgi:amidase